MDQEQGSVPQTNESTREISRETKIRPIFKLITDSFEIYKPIFWKALHVLLTPVALFLTGGFLIGVLFAISNFALSGNIAFVFNIIIGLLGVSLIIFIIIISVIAQTSLYLLVGQADNNPNVKEVFLKAKKFAWKFFTVKITVGLFTLLWMLLFYIPGLIMAVFYSLAVWAFFYEGFTGGQALKRSKELIKDYWWSVFGKFVGVFFIFLLIIVLPTTLIKSAIFASIWGIITQITAFVLVPFFIIYSQLIFKDLKKIKGESTITKKGSSKLIIGIGVTILIIIPLFSTFTVVSLNSVRVKAKDTMIIMDVKQVEAGAELYRADNGFYPDNLDKISNLDNIDITFKDKIEYSKTENGMEICFILEKGINNYKKGRNCLNN